VLQRKHCREIRKQELIWEDLTAGKLREEAMKQKHKEWDEKKKE